MLPIPLHGALAPTGTAGVVGAGVLAGLYHPTTGYSLPEAARFAEWFAGQIALGLDPALLSAAAAHRASEVWQRGSFCRRLNSMMFVAARPLERRRIMAQFYLRGSGLIERFYAGTLRPSDRLRLLSGRPPVSLMSGLKAFFMKSAVG